MITKTLPDPGRPRVCHRCGEWLWWRDSASGWFTEDGTLHYSCRRRRLVPELGSDWITVHLILTLGTAWFFGGWAWVFLAHIVHDLVRRKK